MKKMKKTILDLEAEMRAVAGGEREAPPSPQPRESLSLFGTLTPANAVLLQLIGTAAPASVSELAVLAGRAQSNVSRSLQDLAKLGLVRLLREGVNIRPELSSRTINVDLVDQRWGPAEPLPQGRRHPVALAG